MAQKPRIQVRVVVRRRPRIMAGLGVDGESDVAAEALQRLDHVLRFAEWHHFGLGAVEHPSRNVREVSRQPRRAAPANGSKSSEAVRSGNRERPRAEPAHAEPGTVDAVLVNAIGGDDLIEQGVKGFYVPPPVLGALGRHDHEGKALALLNELYWAVELHLLQVAAALAGAVEEQEQRPLLVGVFVALGKVEQVVGGDDFGDCLLECIGRLTGLVGHAA